MLENKPIFRPSFGNRPDQLIGRDNIIEQILEGLQSYPGSAERSNLIIGQRGMGKTALLLEISDRSKDFDYIPVRVTCGETMLENMIEILQKTGMEYIKEPKKSIKGFNAGVLGFSIGLTFTEEAQRSFGFRVKLELICEKLAKYGKKVLLLVDEVEPTVPQMRELATVYQELVGNEVDIAIIMAGLPGAVSGILNYKTLTFLNRAQRITLELISISEVEAYYYSAFSRAAIEASAEIVKAAAAFTQGFPYQIQLVGFFLSKYSVPGKPIDKEVLQRVKKSVKDEIDNKVLQAMLNPLSDMDLYVLKAIACYDEPIKVSDVEKNTGIAHGTIQTYRKRLMDAGILYSPRRGELAFILPQLAEYLKDR